MHIYTEFSHIFPFIPVSNEPGGRAYRWSFILYQKRISLIQIGTAWWIQPQKTKFRYPAQMAQWNRKWMECVDRDKKRLSEEDNSSKEVIRRPLIRRLCARNLIQASPLIPFKRTISCGLRIVCIRRRKIFKWNIQMKYSDRGRRYAAWFITEQYV